MKMRPITWNGSGFRWSFALGGASAALMLALPTLVCGNGVGAFFATIALAALMAFALLVVAVIKMRRNGLAVLAMLCTFLMLAWALFRTSNDLRWSARWLVHSRSYKAKVVNQPSPEDGTLKHVEWDGWGFAGSYTSVYLVFDPSDRLARATKQHSPVKVSGIPCPVVSVHRLERSWYTVLFYTETDWEYCG